MKINIGQTLTPPFPLTGQGRKTNYISIILIVLALLGIALLLPLILGFGKSGRETKVLGRDYSLLNKKEIVNKLNHDFNFDQKVQLMTDKRMFFVNFASISATIDSDKMASTILYRRLNQGIANYIGAFFKKNDFELEINWDKNKLGEEIVTIAEQINKPFIPTEIVVDKGKIEIKKGELGIEVDKDALANRVIDYIKNYKVEEKFEIPTRTIGGMPTEEEQKSALEIANKLNNKKIILNWENNNSEVSFESIIGWVGLNNNCNEVKIAEYVANFNKSIKQEPKDAAFNFENGKVTQFEASHDGYQIDEKRMVSEMCGSLNKWANSNETEIKYVLPLIKTQAKIKTDEVNNLGISELIGRGTSSFRHSSVIRNFNVQKGSEIVNRILVAPNETFSFIKNLGEVTLDNGFKQAYVINKGKTVLDVGGGICQVSTTLFRAMLDAGLNITSRTAHAYRVSYYEEDSKPGFDATVFIPNPDLKFVNDTGKYVLIQSFYDGVKKTLTYEIYGTKDGRKVEISNYKQWDASPAPPDVWVDDPTLPPGKVVKDESKVPGLKTSFEWKVTKDGQILHQKTFVSNYVPWAAVYRRGPQQ